MGMSDRITVRTKETHTRDEVFKGSDCADSVIEIARKGSLKDRLSATTLKHRRKERGFACQQSGKETSVLCFILLILPSPAAPHMRDAMDRTIDGRE